MSKGSQFERDICRELSLWWTGGERDDIFWRTSQSGGRSTTRAKKGKKTFGQSGDIQAVDPLGRPLLDLVTIELKKGYNRESAFQCLDNLPRGGLYHETQWEKFIGQARGGAVSAGSPFWFLIHKRDHRATMIFMPWCLAQGVPHPSDHLQFAHPSVIMKCGAGWIFGTTLDEFKRRVRPGDLVKVALKPVVRVKRIV